MSLEDAIKELKEEIAAKEKEEEKPIEETIAEEKPVEEVTEPEKKEETKEEPKEEKTTEVKPEVKPDDSGYARLRREAAASKKLADSEAMRRAQLEAEIAALKNPVLETEEPKAAALSPELEEVLQENRQKKAEREFQSLERQFSVKHADYEAVTAEYAMALAQSNRLQNPRGSAEEIGEKTKKDILVKAARYMQQGFDPIEELYHEAKELGFTGKSRQQQAAPSKEEPAKEQEEIRPDMKKLAANRAKSTGMTGSAGKSEGQITKAAAADLSAEEWQRLPVAEKRRLMYG